MYWKSKWLSDYFQCQKRRELKTQSLPHCINHTFSQTPNFPGAKMQGSGDGCPVWVKEFWALGEEWLAQHQETHVLFLTFTSWVLLYRPVHPRSAQVNSSTKEACRGDDGRQAIYWLLFPARSFSCFVTLKNNYLAFQSKPGHNQPYLLHKGVAKVAAASGELWVSPKKPSPALVASLSVFTEEGVITCAISHFGISYVYGKTSNV